MTPNPQRKGSLDDIHAPELLPSPEPSPETEGEDHMLSRAKSRGQVPAKTLQILLHEEIREHLNARCNSLCLENEQLRKELDGLRPEHAKLVQAAQSANWVNIMATVLLASGGGAISSPAFFSWFEQMAVVGAGWSGMVIGGVMLTCNSAFGRAKLRRNNP